jgi:hypothetical protein
VREKLGEIIRFLALSMGIRVNGHQAPVPSRATSHRHCGAPGWRSAPHGSGSPHPPCGSPGAVSRNSRLALTSTCGGVEHRLRGAAGGRQRATGIAGLAKTVCDLLVAH